LSFKRGYINKIKERMSINLNISKKNIFEKKHIKILIFKKIEKKLEKKKKGKRC